MMQSRLSRSDRFNAFHVQKFSWMALSTKYRVNLPLKATRTIKMELSSKNLIQGSGKFTDTIFDRCKITFPRTSSPTSSDIRLSFEPRAMETYVASGNDALVIYLGMDLAHENFLLEQRVSLTGDYSTTRLKKEKLTEMFGPEFWNSKVIILGGAKQGHLPKFVSAFKQYNASPPLDIAGNPAACALLRRRVIGTGCHQLDLIFPNVGPPVDAHAQFQAITRACELHEIDGWMRILDLINNRFGLVAPNIVKSMSYTYSAYFSNDALETIAMCLSWNQEQGPWPRYHFLPINQRGRVPRGGFSLLQDDYIAKFGATIQEQLAEEEDGDEMVVMKKDVGKITGNEGVGNVRQLPRVLEWCIKHQAEKRKNSSSNQQVAGRPEKSASDSTFMGGSIQQRYADRFNSSNEDRVNELLRTHASRCQVREGMSHPPIYASDYAYNHLDLARRSRLRPTKRRLTWLIINRHSDARWVAQKDAYYVLTEGVPPNVKVWFLAAEKSRLRRLAAEAEKERRQLAAEAEKNKALKEQSGV
ncbi:hypothetical protein TWF281_009802 [Arthrobotrys megalospora]